MVILKCDPGTLTIMVSVESRVLRIASLFPNNTVPLVHVTLKQPLLVPLIIWRFGVTILKNQKYSGITKSYIN